MKKFCFLLTLIFLWINSLLINPGIAHGKEIYFKNLPYGILIDSSYEVPQDQIINISKKLGGEIVSLSNTFLTVQGRPIQINILESQTAKDAKILYDVICKMKNHSAFCLKKENTIIEYVSNDPALALKTSYELGLINKPQSIKYLLTAHLAIIEETDYMSLNKLFNLLLNIPASRLTQERIPAVDELSQNFQFGNELTLRTLQQEIEPISYRLNPKPEILSHNTPDTATYLISSPYFLRNIPYVEITASITCNQTGFTVSNRLIKKTLISETRFWPSSDPEIVHLAKLITNKKDSTESKINALLDWLTPGKNIQFGGNIVGSRWGVKKVLKQKLGQCWDFSDLFITLCRSIGIPARQVGGWLYGTSGHIWAEYLIEGKGWQQVDPTGGTKLGCGIYHIPFFTTETGEMPILYISMPTFEIVETN